MKAAFYTLGCKVNHAETEAMAQLFRLAGHQVVPEGEPADITIVNSCTVTAAGDAKSRGILRRAKRENPAAVTVLTGCFPQAFPAEAAIPEADVITGTAARARLVQNVEQFLRTGQRVVDIAPHAPAGRYEELPAIRQDSRTRAFVKVQDGCDGRCAYCIIPAARGPVRSRGQAAILAEVRALAEAGHREVVLSGINLPSYGRDSGDDLASLAEAVASVAGIRRIRLSSLDPHRITPEQVARFAANEKLCHHFHLSLQSGCDTTLARMRRPYTAEQYRAVAAQLLCAMPGASLTTDVIVGFPGETEADFDESLRFVAAMRFLKVHVFPYSRRTGTAAAAFGGQLPKAEKSRRAKALQRAADAGRADWIAGQLGTRQEVLLEKPDAEGRFGGYTKNYVPVLVMAPGHSQGDVVQVRLGPYNGERCSATAQDF